MDAAVQGHLPEAIAGLVIAATVLAKALADHYKGKRRDKSNDESMKSHFGMLRETLNVRFDVIEERIEGVAARVTEVKIRVDDLEQRELDRLERKAYDRRATG